MIGEIKMKNIVAYVRVSHEEQVKYGFSLDAQKEALKEWADNNGVMISHWYIDEGVSARKKVKNRPYSGRFFMCSRKAALIVPCLFPLAFRYSIKSASVPWFSLINTVVVCALLYFATRSKCSFDVFGIIFTPLYQNVNVSIIFVSLSYM